MSAELGLAIAAAVIEIGHLLLGIGNKLNEVQNNRAHHRCERLATEAKMLKTLLEAKSNGVASKEIVQDAQGRVKDIASYIDSIANNTFVDDVKEVAWSQRYHAILSDIARVKDKFLFETLSNTTIAPLAGSVPQATFMLTDPSVIHFADMQDNIGYGTIESIGKFVCYKLEHSKLSLESLRMYPRLQDRAYVQRFKGLANIKGRLYVFMEDCSEWPTLNEVYRRNQEAGPKDLVSRMGLALKIAQTVAHYHGSDVILKAIYDHYIVLRKESNGQWTPILTGLDHMRHLYERTSSFRYDCRYEAPEYRAIRQHTLYSDIWSLGTVVWQVLSAGFPFSIQTSVDSSDNPDQRVSILTSLERNENPGVFSSDFPQYLTDVLRKCWNRDALSRPTARQIAEILQDTWLRLIESKDKTLLPPDPSPAGPINCLVAEARDRALSLVIEQRASHDKKQTVPMTVDRPKLLDIHLTTALANAKDANAGEYAFLLGACIWRTLLDEKSHTFISEKANITYMSEDENCKRAELALSFLQKAARNGNKECYRELSEAYNRLRKYYEKRLKDLGLSAQTAYQQGMST